MFRRPRRLYSSAFALALTLTGCGGGSAGLPSGQSSAVAPPSRVPAGTFLGWLQPGLNAAHTADNRFETTLTPQNVGTLTRGWSFATGATDRAGILTDGATAYVATGDGNLYAVDIPTGTQKWSFPTEYTGESGSWIAISGGTVYAAPCFIGTNTQGAGMCAISARTGRLKWNWYATCQCAPLPFVVTGPAVSSSTVVFAYREGGAYGKDLITALNTAGGAVLWQAVAGDGNPSGSMGPNLPAISGGSVYVGTDTGICSLQLSSGSLNWCSGPNAYTGSPSASKSVVYATVVTASQAILYAFNATTGAKIWQYTPAGGDFGFDDPPAIAGRKVYFAANQEGPVYALNATNGSLIFTAGAGSQGAKTLSAPSVANGVVYVACYAGLCAYNASTGASLLVTGSGGGASQSPAIANGEVFVACASRYTGQCSSGYYGIAMYKLPAAR